MLEDRPFADVVKDLFLHFLSELLSRFLQQLGLRHIFDVERSDYLSDDVEGLEGHVAFHIVLQGEPLVLDVVHSAVLLPDLIFHLLERIDCRGLVKFEFLEPDETFFHVVDAGN